MGGGLAFVNRGAGVGKGLGKLGRGQGVGRRGRVPFKSLKAPNQTCSVCISEKIPLMRACWGPARTPPNTKPFSHNDPPSPGVNKPAVAARA